MQAQTDEATREQLRMKQAESDRLNLNLLEEKHKCQETQMKLREAHTQAAFVKKQISETCQQLKQIQKDLEKLKNIKDQQIISHD